ncbi:MAG: hypothetical protein LQ340_000735 [Diploschistes diacapsis]|nr:MAG: hypothetical protein LQ340_000735 [Diploschistes diacapsis]
MASLGSHEKRHKVTVVGSGNWGSAIAKIVAENTAERTDLFEPDVQMWVFEEDFTMPKDSKDHDSSSELCSKPQKLTKLINHYHENVKYLPGIKLPKNLYANPSLRDAVKDSSILIFNLPHQFIGKICDDLAGHIVPFARGISCIKGVAVSADSVSLFSDVIGSKLGIYCGALSGANIANEIAQEKFSETTVAYDPPPMDSQNPTPKGPSPQASMQNLTEIRESIPMGTRKARLHAMPSEYPPLDRTTLKALFHRNYFHVRIVSDVTAVSLAGALKNIVALAAGFVSGLGWGDNAKAAIMRVGLMEMVKFGHMFFESSGIRTETFTEESAGVADLITSCSGGRNFRCAKMSVEKKVDIREIEKSELNGQSLQGIGTAEEVNQFLSSRGKEADFPLMTAVHGMSEQIAPACFTGANGFIVILSGKAKPEDLPDLIEGAVTAKL